MKMALFLLALLLGPLAQAAEIYHIKLGSRTADLKFVDKPKTDVQLEFYTDGKLRQTFEDMGSEFAKIGFKGKWNSVLAADLDHNGFDIVLVRTRIKPLTGALWVFRFDHDKKVFEQLTNDRGDRYIPVPIEGVVELFPNGEIAFPGLAGGPAVRYKWTATGFRRK